MARGEASLRSRLSGRTEGLLALGTDPALADLFPGRFWLEAASARAVARWRAEGRGLPVVASRPVHYARPADRGRFDVVQSIRTRTLLRQEHPRKRKGGELAFPGDGFAARWFPGCEPELAHAREIAGRCAFALRPGPPQFPAFAAPGGTTSRAFLRELVLRGLRDRYGAPWRRHWRRAEGELATVAEVGYEDYFLLVWDLLQECRARGIEWITRGSAADSLVCYALGISGICPVRFRLDFRRFLNPERMGMSKLPDVDLDFACDRRDAVADLVFARHGPERTALVGGFSTFLGRSAFADVAKVLGVPEPEVRRLTRRIPRLHASELGEAVASLRECADLPFREEPYRTALEAAAFLDGFPRHAKIHPCGVVISRGPIRDLTPTFASAKGLPATHFDMDSVEAIGLVKLDLLSQGGLAVLRDARAALRARGEPADLAALEPWEDPEVWEMIASGGARAVHHIESPAMTGLCRRSGVRDLDALVALVSVIRPGAANQGKKVAFSRRYQGLEPPRFPHPSVEPFLGETYGLVVFEEQVLQVGEAFAGMRPGRADLLRRALVRRKQDRIAELGREFVEGARALGRPEAAIAEVWAVVEGFQGYAFCKAHSAAYAVEAWQGAWMKRYHPAEFLAAVLTHGKGFYDPLVYVLECHRLGIPILPPSINRPGPAYATEPLAPPPPLPRVSASSPVGAAANGESPCAFPPPHFALLASRSSLLTGIRVPALRAAGLGDALKERVLRELGAKPFASLADFFRRAAPAREEAEALMHAGAFDEWGQPRTSQFWAIQALAASPSRAAPQGQGWLAVAEPGPAAPDVPLTEPTRAQRLQREQELLGFPVSGHPLDLHGDVAWESYCPVAALGRHAGERVVCCGLVVEQRMHVQSTGETMKFLTIADRTGIVETDLFGETYRAYGLATVRYPVLEVEATVQPYENGRGVELTVHRAGPPRRKTSRRGAKAQG
jgi:error-prone DNA polymerase